MAKMVLIAAPTASVISVAEVREMLNLGPTPSDAMIEAMVEAVVGTLDPAAGGWLGRSLCPATWELHLDAFPTATPPTWFGDGDNGGIELPYPPVTSVLSVAYDDPAGAEQPLVEDADYRVLWLGAHYRTTVLPLYGGAWPTALGYPAAVRVRFLAGYSPAAMPRSIKAAVALGVQHLISSSERNLFVSAEQVDGVGSRQYVVTENAAKVMQATTESLLATYRVLPAAAWQL
jgi:uncharacterized phiE125 gp8 family phage protein